MELTALHLTLVLYLLSTAAALIVSFRASSRWERLSFWSLDLGLATHIFALISRGINAGRLPFTSLYESLLIFAGGISGISAYLAHRRHLVAVIAASLPIACAALVYAFQLDSTIRPLPPALHSSWLFVHVSLAIISYGAFAVSGGLGVLYLVLDSLKRKQKELPARLPQLESVDKLIFSMVSLAFPCLILVIASGAIWAQQAWGAYWSWDPKETWALITAIVYAFFLHARLKWGWHGTRIAWMAILGFAVVLFCYLGVNLLMSGLHSYGSPN